MSPTVCRNRLPFAIGTQRSQPRARPAARGGCPLVDFPELSRHGRDTFAKRSCTLILPPVFL